MKVADLKTKVNSLKLGYTWNQIKTMPKKMEEALKRSAAKKGLKGKRRDAYIYGTLRKSGWKPKRRKKKNDRGRNNPRYRGSKHRGYCA